MSHGQTIARLWRKLEGAHSLLRSNVDIASILSNTPKKCKTEEQFQSVVQQYTRRLSCHVRNEIRQPVFSQDIPVLVSYIRAIY